jgi:hypothetical protein
MLGLDVEATGRSGQNIVQPEKLLRSRLNFHANIDDEY